MEIFTRFNRKNIQDRQIDTLIGLSKGLVADGKVDQAEAEFLYTWLIQNAPVINNPLIQNLLNKVSAMLDDGLLDKEESVELLAILHQLTGETAAIGEVGKPASLPLDEPAPEVAFIDGAFLFTGTFAFGTRNECKDIIENLGGRNLTTVTKKLDYLILGTYVTDSWIHETFGRKIEKAISYRNDGVPIKIISEEHWVNQANL